MLSTEVMGLTMTSNGLTLTQHLSIGLTSNKLIQKDIMPLDLLRIRLIRRKVFQMAFPQID